MMLILLLLVADRRYHLVAIEQMAANRQTHVCVIAPLVYKRLQQDGDWHLTLAKTVKGIHYTVVVEVIPLIPLAIPKVGQVVNACGIARYDTRHRFHEIHPAETLTVVRE